MISTRKSARVHWAAVFEGVWQRHQLAKLCSCVIVELPRLVPVYFKVTPMIRRIVPQSLKRRLKLVQRALADRRSGVARRFASRPPSGDFEHHLSLSQPILNATDEESRRNKIHNIKVAAAAIETVQIEPGEVFSFWQLVGEPSHRNNFKRGINIIRGKVIEDFGGGLCQLSGIVYHVSLMAGLSVLERANHSVDLYHDTERYTPLGADCAVFYGYKDLRLQNDLSHPVRFRLAVSDETLTCFVESPERLEEITLSFDILRDDEDGADVVTRGGGRKLAESSYKKGAASLAKAAEIDLRSNVHIAAVPAQLERH